MAEVAFNSLGRVLPPCQEDVEAAGEMGLWENWSDCDPPLGCYALDYV